MIRSSSSNDNSRTYPGYRSNQKEVPVRPQPAYDRFILTLFYLFSLYMVLPIGNVPLSGLSLSAPIFFVIAVTCMVRPPRPWFGAYRGWIILAVLLWLGIFLSTMLNGLVSGGVAIGNQGILTVVRYAYWLLAFVITAYFASQGKVLKTVAGILGWGVMVLALLRLGEVVIYGNIGAWTGTHVMSENDYGFLFSIFSPFLLVLMIEQRRFKRLLAMAGMLFVWGAAGINGSRGSWISMGVGLALCLFLLAWSRSRKVAGLLFMLLFMAVLLLAAWVALPQVAAKVMVRANTLQALEQDKSYVERQVLVQKGLRLFEQSPLIGVGAGRFTQTYVPLDKPSLLSSSEAALNTITAHNSYLDFLAESGLAGALPYAILLIMLALQGLSSAYRGLRRGELLGLAVFLAFVQMSIHMWVISSLTNTANWFIYGLVVAVFMLSKRESAIAREVSQGSGVQEPSHLK